MKRYRWRYLIICVHTKHSIDVKELQWTIVNEAKMLHGDQGLSTLGLRFLNFNPPFLVVRCSHKSLTMLRAVVAFINKLEGHDVLLHVKRVTGTLKKARKILKQYLKTT